MDPINPNSDSEEIMLEEEEIDPDFDLIPIELDTDRTKEASSSKIIEEKEAESEKLYKSNKQQLLLAKKSFYEEFLKNCVK